MQDGETTERFSDGILENSDIEISTYKNHQKIQTDNYTVHIPEKLNPNLNLLRNQVEMVAPLEEQGLQDSIQTLSDKDLIKEKLINQATSNTDINSATNSKNSLLALPNITSSTSEDLNKIETKNSFDSKFNPLANPLTESLNGSNNENIQNHETIIASNTLKNNLQNPNFYDIALKDSLRSNIDQQIFQAWFEPTIFTATNDVLIVSAPNTFFRDYIQKNFGGFLQSLSIELFKISKIEFQVEPQKKEIRIGQNQASLRTQEQASFSVGGTNNNSDRNLDGRIGFKRFATEVVPSQGQMPGNSMSVQGNNLSGRLNNNLNNSYLKRGPVEGVESARENSQSNSGTLDVYSNKITTAPEQNKVDTTNINIKYNFSNFVVGSCNQFAQAACLRVAENLGVSYNPLFIYGGVGLGKTHLANAIGNATRRRHRSALLVSSETFVSELILSLKSNRVEHFKSKFRSLDLLIIDDIQFLEGKERTQEEFFHTFNELYNKQKQIVLTSDKLPQQLTGLEERLRTRFASGLSVDLQAPDYETRIAILVQKAEQAGMKLCQKIAELIAAKIDTNVRELEGALNRLQAMSSISGREIDEEMLAQQLFIRSASSQRKVTHELIQKIVSEHYSVSLADLVGKRRTQNIAFARQVAMYLCRKITGHSYPEIGFYFGDREHGTVMHAYRLVGEREKDDVNFKDNLAKIEREILG